MVSIILTAWKEKGTVGKAVEKILDQIPEITDDVELILVCPDKSTADEVTAAVRTRKFEPFIYIKDPGKGKPHALNLALHRARGEIIISTDGDVFIGPDALSALLKPFSDSKVGGVTGRPVCANSRRNMWGYWGHMFIDAAHKKRTATLGRGRFYVMSGYLLAFRNIGWKIPDGVLDDVYFSYKLQEEDYKLAYAPEAHVYVKQPANLKDWMTQKVRSVSGHADLPEYVGEIPDTRSIAKDLQYVFFPIEYARNLRELVWSFLHYPLRLYVWIKSFYVVSIRKNRATDVWERVSSTK